MKSNYRALLDVCILNVCAALVLALLLPRIAEYRSLARSNGCTANLYQLGLTLHNYHAAFRQLPPGSGGTVGGATIADSNQGRISPLVAILPFVEQQQLWEQIINPYTNAATGKTFPSMGPVPWYDPNEYEPWSRSPSVFRCPEQMTDQAAKLVETAPIIVYGWDNPAADSTVSNYVVSYGDSAFAAGVAVDPKNTASISRSRASNRGLFHANMKILFRDILDGLSNTVMISETVSSIQGGAGPSGIAKDVAGLSMKPSLCLAKATRSLVRKVPMAFGVHWAPVRRPRPCVSTQLVSKSYRERSGQLNPPVKPTARQTGSSSHGATALVDNRLALDWCESSIPKQLS